MAGGQIVTVIRLTLNRGFWSTLACIVVRVLKDFFVITAALSWTSKRSFSGFPLLQIWFQEVPLEELRQQVIINWYSWWWITKPVLALQALHLSSVSFHKRKICLYVRLSKVPLTCNFQISLRQRFRAALGMGNQGFGVFAVLVTYSLSLYCSSLSRQGQESLLLAGC